MMANALVRYSILAVALIGVFLTPAAIADSAQSSHVLPGSKAADLDACVRETGFMRRNHMELIKHQRDATVHQGIRATTDTLAGCIDCHVSYDQREQPVSVYSDGQFCKACHEFAAVDVNCFGCHATVPVYPVAEPKREVPPPVARPTFPSPEGIAVAGVARTVEQGVGK